jgi:hypothetical protein
MGEFWSDFGDGFETPFKWVGGKFDKVDKLTDKAADGAGNLVDLIGGNSNALIYIGIAIVAVAILPTILNKTL